MSEEFEPRILAYCCQWCSYAAADLAGSMRLQYPPNVRIIQVPCTGRVDLLYLLRALEDGADGVFLSGCLLDDCHYVNGNYKALKRVEKAKEMLEALGIEPERVEMFFNSSAMGPQFAQTCNDFTERIRQLGPLYPQPRQAAAGA
ncbi:hydrogenase iron-sulfur subunit [Desulfoferula mesophila]|uniref:Methyl-viologen-reducing hydrogenase subunit delta n=1 Tax=Desulfoferula mesophila TaxID=3058419 RepID=A0AAU9EJF3_9BACT|nr:methyl-viologen-reducing hydrogenase subunit delta [Desulfoferula mesophilus]